MTVTAIMIKLSDNDDVWVLYGAGAMIVKMHQKRLLKYAMQQQRSGNSSYVLIHKVCNCKVQPHESERANMEHEHHNPCNAGCSVVSLKLTMGVQAPVCKSTVSRRPRR